MGRVGRKSLALWLWHWVLDVGCWVLDVDVRSSPSILHSPFSDLRSLAHCLFPAQTSFRLSPGDHHKVIGKVLLTDGRILAAVGELADAVDDVVTEFGDLNLVVLVRVALEML